MCPNLVTIAGDILYRYGGRRVCGWVVQFDMKLRLACAWAEFDKKNISLYQPHSCSNV